MKPELYFILERFPKLKEPIKFQFGCDDEFRALCLDYFLCLKSLDNWETTISKFKERHKEYRELQAVLEEKMLQHIKNDTYRAVVPSDSKVS